MPLEGQKAGFQVKQCAQQHLKITHLDCLFRIINRLISSQQTQK